MKQPFVLLTLSVTALWAAFAVGVAQFLARLWPGVNFLPLVVISALVALESQAAWRYLHAEHLGWFDWPGIRYVLVEWGGLALLIKALTYLPGGFGALQRDAAAWEANFSTFFNAAYLGALGFGFAIWVLARQCAADLERLRIHESDRQWERLPKLEADRHTARRRLGARLFGAGALLVLLTGLTRLDAGQIFHNSAAADGALRSLVVYFALTVLLLGQSWLALLQGRWWWQAVPVQAEVPRRWAVAAFGVLCASGLLALILPAHYTLGLLDALRVLLAWVAQAASYLFFVLLLLVSLITTPFFWVLRLLSGRPAQNHADTLPLGTPPPPPFPKPPPASAGLPWWETLRGVLFWALFLGVLTWVAVQYLRQNRAWWERVRGWPLVTGMRAFWARLRAFLRNAGEQAGVVAIAGRKYLTRLRRDSRSPRGGTLFRGRTPRERIFFYYHRMLQRGAQAGMPRRPAETPREYARRLCQALETDRQVKILTETFETARYQPSPAVSTSLVWQARQAWQALRRQLRI